MAENMKYLELLLARYPKLNSCQEEIRSAFELLADCYDRGGCVFTCGNGGSAADAEHMVGELLKGFLLKRPLSDEDRAELHRLGQDDGTFLADHLQYGLRAVCLMSQVAVASATANDQGGDLGAAQQLFALGQPGDVLIAFSTSGNARNVAYATLVAKQRGLKVIGMSGQSGGRLNSLADTCIHAPETETYLIQELHLPIYHCLCMMIEARYFKK
ncbi:MAG: SIS domain-containing protein [Lentisphaeria bacterium]|nr:SIS domain-containing protein [Lentisphaeria bacterium]